MAHSPFQRGGRGKEINKERKAIPLGEVAAGFAGIFFAGTAVGLLGAAGLIGAAGLTAASFLLAANVTAAGAKSRY